MFIEDDPDSSDMQVQVDHYSHCQRLDAPAYGLIFLHRRYESEPKSTSVCFQPNAAESRCALVCGKHCDSSAHWQPNGSCGYVGFRTDQVPKKSHHPLPRLVAFLFPAKSDTAREKATVKQSTFLIPNHFSRSYEPVRAGYLARAFGLFAGETR
jgi:hypothetical protein